MLPSRIQSAVDAAGIQAARIEWLWWLMFWVTAAVFVLVLGALAAAVVRGRSAAPHRPSERAAVIAVGAATGATIAVLFGLLYASAAVGREIGTRPGTAPLVVQITGYQWWWAIEYVHEQPALRVTAANELHIPVGRPVVINLRAADVIHSFWVPSLHGKVDLVPGRLNTTWLQADRAGIFRGQCAEFCGLQHAHMALTVVAEPARAFDAWLDAQRRNAAEPGTPQESRGREVVETGSCALCHTIRGTSAGARFGPDLTHVASRGTIAAGTAPNTRGYLAAWIADPQQLKPGTRMPATGLTPEDQQAVVAYLESLR